MKNKAIRRHQRQALAKRVSKYQCTHQSSIDTPKGCVPHQARRENGRKRKAKDSTLAERKADITMREGIEAIISICEAQRGWGKTYE